jgi:hypothetical protein
MYFQKSPEGRISKYTGCIQDTPNPKIEEHKSKKSEKEQSNIECSVTLHVNKVGSTNLFKLSEPVSQSSKLRAFCSLQLPNISITD